MSIKSRLILSLLFSSIFGYSQGKTTFNTYTDGHTERIALKADSTFIFCRAICTLNKTVSGKYTVKNGIYYLNAMHLEHDAVPIGIITLNDTAHIYFPNKTINYPLAPKIITINYPLDLGVPEKLTFRNGEMFVWDSRSNNWILFYPTTNSLY